MKTYTISFQTDLNASMRVEIKARSWKDAIKKLLKEYPSAFDIDGQ
jgi:FKBP-type peptidyl-prolyl cis-trans isomerase (trigger factor)